MELVGAAFPITPLLSQCTKITSILRELGRKFKRAPSLMTSIATECNMIHVALAQLTSFDWDSLASYSDGRREQMTRATEAIVLGCTLTLSVIEEYAVELQEYVEGPNLSPTEQAGVMARVKVLWKEEEMRELLHQLRGYQTGLMNLLRAVHDESLEDLNETLAAQGTNFSSLLQQSRSSRMRKPLSIRAAMQQSATYSGLSMTPTTQSSASPNPQSRYSTARSHSSTSSVTGSSSVSSINGNASPSTNDTYTRSLLQATSNKKLVSDGARKKRPAFLVLQPEDPAETVYDGNYVHTKRDKDQLRKSSPTVGEKFRFIPGAPPESEHGRHLAGNSRRRRHAGSRPRQDMDVMEALEVVDEPEDPEDAEEETTLDDELSKSIYELTEENRKTPSPPSATVEDVSFQEDATPAPRKQKSSSSIRSQVHNLPESARLRKQASAGKLTNLQPELPPHPQVIRRAKVQKPQPRRRIQQRHSPQMTHQFQQSPRSGEQHFQPMAPNQGQPLLATGPPPNNPPPPVPVAMHRSPSADALALKDGPLPLPPRSQSLEAQARRRVATDNASHPHRANGSDPTPLPLRTKRLMQRSMSDAQRSGGPRHAMPAQPEESDEESPPEGYAYASSPHTHTSVESESWPLSAETKQQQLEYDDQYQQRQAPSSSSVHSRTTSTTTSASSQRASTLSVDPTPRTSRNNTPLNGTPYSGTPRNGRSRSNTLRTIESDTHGEQVDDAVSIAPSVAPSVMSAQWYRTPRERLGLGSRVSHAEPLPWELGADEEQADEAKPLPQGTSRLRKAPLFSVFPPRAPSRQREEPTKDRPQSPVLSEKFLVNIKDNMADKEALRQGGHHNELQRRPSTAAGFHSRDDGVESPDPDKGKAKKPKKDSRFPTLGEMISEYKNMSSKWYTVAPEGGSDRASSTNDRPSTGSNSMMSNGNTIITATKDEPEQSVRSPTTASVITSTSSSTGPVPKAANEIGKTGGSKASSRRSLDTASSGSSSRLSRDGGRANKKPKKSKAFPSLSEFVKEYKEMTSTWYTAPYQTERPRNAATPNPSLVQPRIE